MPLTFNVRQAEKDALTLEGEIPAEDLDWGNTDDCIQTLQPIRYHIEVQLLNGAYVAQGTVGTVLDCTCVRCLKKFQEPIEIEGWACHVVTEGEDAVKVVNDCIDLTPFLREDILLAFPQHPLCEPGCPGLGHASPGGEHPLSGDRQGEGQTSAWAELNKLKL